MDDCLIQKWKIGKYATNKTGKKAWTGMLYPSEWVDIWTLTATAEAVLLKTSLTYFQFMMMFYSLLELTAMKSQPLSLG